MGKHFDTKNEVLFRTTFNDLPEAGKKYKDGDAIQQSERVINVEYFMQTEDYKYQKVVLNRDMIIDLHAKLVEIEKNIITGEYSSLPF